MFIWENTRCCNTKTNKHEITLCDSTFESIKYRNRIKFYRIVCEMIQLIYLSFTSSGFICSCHHVISKATFHFFFFFSLAQLAQLIKPNIFTENSIWFFSVIHLKVQQLRLNYTNSNSFDNYGRNKSTTINTQRKVTQIKLTLPIYNTFSQNSMAWIYRNEWLDLSTHFTGIEYTNKIAQFLYTPI